MFANISKLRVVDKDGNKVLTEKHNDWFQIHSNYRTILRTKIDVPEEISVSTVSLRVFIFDSIDHDDDIFQFETMVFGGEFCGAQMRYYSEEEALKKHEFWVNLCLAAYQLKEKGFEFKDYPMGCDWLEDQGRYKLAEDLRSYLNGGPNACLVALEQNRLS